MIWEEQKKLAKQALESNRLETYCFQVEDFKLLCREPLEELGVACSG